MVTIANNISIGTNVKISTMSGPGPGPTLIPPNLLQKMKHFLF